MRLASSCTRVLGMFVGSIAVLAGCVQYPTALIPEGSSAVFAHETQASTVGAQEMSVEDVLAAARGDRPPESARSAPRADGKRPPITVDQLLAAARGTTGVAAPNYTTAGRLVLPIVESGANTAELDESTIARLDAAVERLPSARAVRASIAIGPATSGDLIAGLARAQRLAQSVASSLPERARPARLVYRPDLRPGELVVEFTIAEAGTDG